jgi:hypothetical protein
MILAQKLHDVTLQHVITTAASHLGGNLCLLVLSASPMTDNYPKGWVAVGFASARALGLRLFIINKKYHNTLGAP